MGITTPAVLVRAALPQWDAIVPADGDVAKSTLWKPIRQFPAGLDAAARQRIEDEYRELLRGEILPAMRAFATYAREGYLPYARSTDGIAAIAGGARMYRHRVRLHTTTDLTPDEIHELGLKEVRRIQTQLILVAAQAGFKGESLGHEMKLYDEPLSLMGRYIAELFRAARLVVDTGLHSRGWTRERAIRYLMEEAGLAEPRATAEIQRYMAVPAQALGYKLGEAAILELRAEAERRMGPRFDIRAFHDVILGQGHLPLSMLRERVRRWIDTLRPEAGNFLPVIP